MKQVAAVIFVAKQTKVSDFDISESFFYQLTRPFHEFVPLPKGQLISNLQIYQKNKDFIKDFCPSLKRGQI